MEGSMKSN